MKYQSIPIPKFPKLAYGLIEHYHPVPFTDSPNLLNMCGYLNLFYYNITFLVKPDNRIATLDVKLDDQTGGEKLAI
jgi:hypothetical protein